MEFFSNIKSYIFIFDFRYYTCNANKWFADFVFLFFHCQVLIETREASSVITWDFDVCKGDAVFNIYHSRKAPQTQKRDTLGNLTSPGVNNVQVIETAWLLGKDYSLVETPLTCKEGESIQVSPDDTSHTLTISNKFCNSVL